MVEQYTQETFPTVVSVVTGSTAATAAITTAMTAIAGLTPYLAGFSVQGVGGSAAMGPLTIGPFNTEGSTSTATLRYYGATSGSGSAYTWAFSPPLAGVGQNSAITLITTAATTATTVVTALWGYYI